ncbi:hypothetical protein QCE73_37305 [Caballeronia sp. LZ029]|uniref:hypothetical protein n=1 Tax=Caballeronia sp. LZ029 TaxID=3038564 RepID=UPI00285DE432|nr:hypothetical protein [Caballeronia sp. LZ029]MDR5748840.1 hypothetical protein [Caballeronia sp. LZ029]
MKITPMIGSFTLEGVEYIESSERLALVEHRVPGLKGNYFQQLGSVPNAIIVRGTRFGDDARDTFLTGIRDIFNKAEPTTFVADINTATDITDVLLEDLHFAEVGGGPDTFQYEIRIRKYVKPPDPPKTDLLDTGILNDAMGALDALDTLDSLASASSLGDPTPPLSDALKSVESATSELPAVLDSVNALTGALPSSEPKTDSLTAVVGDEVSGTGVAGVLGLLKKLDGGALSASLSVNLGDSFSAKVSVDAPQGTANDVSQVQATVDAVPKDPSALIGPLSSKLDGINKLATSDLVAHLQGGLEGIETLRSVMPEDAYMLISEIVDNVASFKGEFLQGEFSEIRQWSDSVKALYDEIAPLFEGGGNIEDRLIEFLRQKVDGVIALLLPDGSAHGQIVKGIESALSVDIVAHVAELKASLLESLRLAKIEFDAGNFTNTVHLGNAVDTFRQLAGTLSSFTASVRPVFDIDVASPDVVARKLGDLYDNFTAINLVDLGNIRDKFARAISSAEEKVNGLKLDVVEQTIQRVFDKIDAALGKFNLDGYASKLDSIREQVDGLLQKLDGALLECVAAMRKVFTQIREAIRNLADNLGSYDESGKFHFKVEQEVTTFLEGIRTHLHDAIAPMVTEFKATVASTLNQVQSALGSITSEIEKVQADLKGSLDQVHGQLQTVDVKGTMDTIRKKLDELLGKLGTVDFDIVVNPVIDEINSMGAALKKINISSMNEFAIGALKVSVSVVVHMNFSAAITDVLMAQFDKIIAMPKDALVQVQGKVEGSIRQFGAIAPQALLAPLTTVFKPVQEQLDALNLENLIKPLDEWYANLEQSLDEISPAALLKPLIDLFDQLKAAIGAVSPAQLVAPLQASIDGLKAQITGIDLHGVAAGLEGGFDKLIAQIDKLSPAQLLTSLVKGFDRIMAALDAFSPGTLLQPFNELFGKIGVLLANITTEQVRIVSQVFDALREAIAVFDPEGVYQVLREKFAALAAVADKLDIGSLMASIRGPFEALNVSFQAKAGDKEVSLSASVNGLNPLRDPSIGQAVSDLQSFQGKLVAMAGAQPPVALVSRYKEIKEKLESLVPVWAKSGISADSVRRAFETASPLNLAAEIDHLYDVLKQRVRVFEPRAIQTRLQGSFEKLKAPLLVLDPRKLVIQVQDLIATIGTRLDAIDLELVSRELQSLADEIVNVVSGLDPRPIIAQLQGLMDEVKGGFDALKPSTLLADLVPAFESAKAVVEQFSPARFIADIQAVFDDIQKLLLEIDLTEVLSPITDRLQDLRDKLEAALKKTEAAFNGMLQAIPV